MKTHIGKEHGSLRKLYHINMNRDWLIARITEVTKFENVTKGILILNIFLELYSGKGSRLAWIRF